MLASYLLSRTLVPTMMAYLLESELDMYQDGAWCSAADGDRSGRAHHLFNALFERLRYRYMGLLDWSLHHRGRVLAAFLSVSIASLGLAMLIGEDFFPAVDAGQMRLHARGPAGHAHRRDRTEFAALEREIRSVIPPDEIDMLIDNIGIPNSWPAIAQGDIPTISSADGEILISLNKEKHAPTARL